MGGSAELLLTLVLICSSDRGTLCWPLELLQSSDGMKYTEQRGQLTPELLTKGPILWSSEQPQCRVGDTVHLSALNPQLYPCRPVENKTITQAQFGLQILIWVVIIYKPEEKQTKTNLIFRVQVEFAGLRVSKTIFLLINWSNLASSTQDVSLNYCSEKSYTLSIYLKSNIQIFFAVY